MHVRKRLTQSSLRGLGLIQVRHVTPVSFNAARGGVAKVYQELERDFGILAPPVALHSPAPETLAATWLILRETLIVPGLVPRARKEAVASAVSVANECPFCIGMHTSTLGTLLPGRHSLVPAAEAGTTGPVTDPSVRDVAAWAKENSARATAGRGPVPFPPEQTPELVGTALALHYLNRMVNIFLGEVPLPPHAPAKSLGAVMRVLTWLITSSAKPSMAPGTSLDLLPAAELPKDLSWAATTPAVAEAFARGSAAMEVAAERSVPEPVRELVRAELDAWDGQSPGISRAWVEKSTADLAPEHRAAGRLALLTAIASYQVDEKVIAAFRETAPDDSTLIELTGWASLTAARRVGAWLNPAS
ncbi:carboxymuconolactone decarboxylase family protein [Streptomyces sp. KK5PA1]|uniref:Carboxymuconolactone decarboxylase family protein n=1 Tax=Actinacidiphila acididurans TaxID=2784346 RepID=A0ABS2TZV4_9ACTN|nr:carboxymuconolactone decarboxylase family protein [Actinacidiphila acididurans]